VSSSVPLEGDGDKPLSGGKKRKIENKNSAAASSPLAFSSSRQQTLDRSSPDTHISEMRSPKQELDTLPEEIETEEPPDHISSPAPIAFSADAVPQDERPGEKTGMARPKRQVAMHRPDYHALHHHIATPTARWLDLIHDPAKYNTEIKDGQLSPPVRTSS
jgi:hypothetical protein